MKDETPAHNANVITEYLNNRFHNKWLQIEVTFFSLNVLQI